jgi:hypothetical protein
MYMLMSKRIIEFGEYNIEEIEEMTKSSSKKSSSSKTPSSSRLLPLRSSNKKARLEPITVEDDPEPKPVPVNAVPIAQIEPHPAIRDPQNAVLQVTSNMFTYLLNEGH